MKYKKNPKTVGWLILFILGVLGVVITVAKTGVSEGMTAAVPFFPDSVIIIISMIVAMLGFVMWIDRKWNEEKIHKQYLINNLTDNYYQEISVDGLTDIIACEIIKDAKVEARLDERYRDKVHLRIVMSNNEQHEFKVSRFYLKSIISDIKQQEIE